MVYQSVGGQVKGIYTFKFWKHKYGSVVTSIPGEVWEFSPESQLKGFNLAFEKEFLLTFFNDPHFLDRFPNS